MQQFQTERVVKGYSGRPVVDGVDIRVGRGEIVGLLGPNGAGKTTTFAMMVGYVRPDGGRILLDGRDITDVPMYQRARSARSGALEAGDGARRRRADSEPQ